MAAARVGDIDEARRLLQEVTQESPHNVRAWLELAWVVETLEEKRACFAKVLELAPDHVEAKAGLARVEEKLATRAPAGSAVAGVAEQGGQAVCYQHPDIETNLRCNRCGKPICPKCAHRSPVGFRCAACVAEIENRYYSNVKDGAINPFDRPLDKPFFSTILLGLIVVVWVAMEVAGGSTNNDVLIRFGANYGPLILDGEIWRLFTSMFLHIGVQHLAFNFVGLVAFGFEMERIYGRYRYLFIYILAGLFGSLASFALKGPFQYSAGASGAIFGIIGMNFAFFLYYRRRLGEYGRQRRNMVLVLVGISLVLGFTVMPVDNAAHLGGAVAGFILGYGLVPRYRVDPTREGADRLVDRGSLLRQWWIPLLSSMVLVGGLWGSLSYWSGLADWPSIMGVSPDEAALSEPAFDEAMIEYGQTVQGDLSNEYFIDTWVFAGQAGDTISITMSSDSLEGYVDLYDQHDEYLTGDNSTKPRYNAFIEDYVLPASGDYFIYVGNYDDNDANYELTLSLSEQAD